MKLSFQCCWHDVVMKAFWKIIFCFLFFYFSQCVACAIYLSFRLQRALPPLNFSVSAFFNLKKNVHINHAVNVTVSISYLRKNWFLQYSSIWYFIDAEVWSCKKNKKLNTTMKRCKCYKMKYIWKRWFDMWKKSLSTSL